MNYGSERPNLHPRLKRVPREQVHGNLSEMTGYVASTLVLFMLVAMDMRVLRSVAIFSNILHMVLKPLNTVRLAEIVRTTRATGDLTQTEGVVRAQTLRTDVRAHGQPPIAPWPICLSRPFRTAQTAHPA